MIKLEEVTETIRSLNLKATQVSDSGDAMRLTQAGLNAAHSFATLVAAQKAGPN